MANPLVRFIREHLSTGSILAEAFYGIWMVVVVTGTIRAVEQPNDSTVKVMLVSALGVNIAWGVIDGITSMWADLVDRTKELELVNALRSKKGDAELRRRLGKALSGTVAGSLSGEELERVVDMVEAGEPGTTRHARPDREDYEAAVATALIDFILIFPVTLPYLLFMNNLTLAIRSSQVIALVLFAGLGYAYARNANWSRIATPIVFALTMLVVIAFSFRLGW